MNTWVKCFGLQCVILRHADVNFITAFLKDLKQDRENTEQLLRWKAVLASIYRYKFIVGINTSGAAEILIHCQQFYPITVNKPMPWFCLPFANGLRIIVTKQYSTRLLKPLPLLQQASHFKGSK